MKNNVIVIEENIEDGVYRRWIIYIEEWNIEEKIEGVLYRRQNVYIEEQNIEVYRRNIEVDRRIEQRRRIQKIFRRMIKIDRSRDLKIEDKKIIQKKCIFKQKV